MSKISPLKAATIDLWQVNFQDLETNVNSLKALLNDAECSRMERFKTNKLQNHYLITHGLLRKILSRYCQIPAKNLCFSKNQYGKPSLELSAGKLKFNLSHSGDKLIIAIAQNIEIGIDIEQINPDINLKIAKRYFTKLENQQLDKAKPATQPLTFFKIWTGKEAIVKMTGLGITNTLQTFSVDSTNDEQIVKLANNQLGYLRYIDAPDGFVAALAASKRIKHLNIRPITDEEIRIKKS